MKLLEESTRWGMAAGKGCVKAGADMGTWLYS